METLNLNDEINVKFHHFERVNNNLYKYNKKYFKLFGTNTSSNHCWIENAIMVELIDLDTATGKFVFGTTFSRMGVYCGGGSVQAGNEFLFYDPNILKNFNEKIISEKEETGLETIEIVEHGLMMSDYFQGTNGVWLNIYPDHETTKGEALEMLDDEINVLYDHIEYTAEYNEFSGNLWEQIDDEIKRMKEYIKGKENELLCPGIGLSEDEDSEQPVYIFTIEFKGEK